MEETSRQNAALGLVLLFAAAGVVFWAAANSTYEFVSPSLHAAIEFFAVAVAICVAWLSHKAFCATGSTRMMLICVAFATMAVFDVFHALAFEGMPKTLVPVGTNVTLFYWIPARLLGALLLFASAVLPERMIQNKERARIGRTVCTVVLAVLAASIILIATSYESLPPMFIPGKGLTQLKIQLEHAAMLLYAVTAALYLWAFLKHGRLLPYLFAVGLLLSAFSEFAFTLYSTPWDMFVWAGHALKVVAFAAFGAGVARLLLKQGS